MSRDKYSPRDEENRQEPEDIIRFQAPSRSPLQRRREARDEKLRRLRPSTPPREREGRYRESDQPTARTRQTRTFREERGERGEQEEERERPHRQESPEPRSTRPIREDRYRDDGPRATGPRPSRDLREYDYPEERYTNTPRRREVDTGIERDTDYNTYRRPVRRSGTRSSPPPASASRTPKRRARRSIWSSLLIGVIGGIITIALVAGIGWFVLIHTLQVNFPGLGIGTSTYTSSQQSAPLNITASITQLQVMDSSGTITISDNSTATGGGILTYVKHTQASSSSSAASDFARIQVKVQPGNSAACPATSCMAVSVNAPATIPATVDLNLVLPPQSPSPPFVLAAATHKGDVKVQGFSGLLWLTVDTGNVDVKGSLMAAGSCLQDRSGNIAFAGTLETGAAPAINPCKGNPVGTPNSTQPWYEITSGTGNVDISLNSVTANQIFLDAFVTVQGKISSEYPITIPPGSPPSYEGPLLSGTQPTARLLVIVDTGNITLHKV